MPDRVKRVVFTAELLPEVQNFRCGHEEWEEEVAVWIRATDPKNSVLTDMKQYGTRVWLYFNQQELLVGFGSLGENRWSIEPDTPKMPISIIPMLGVDERFQGEPRGAGEVTYAKQILLDLRHEAEKKKQTHPVLGLCVHPQNKRALAFYIRNDFAVIEPALKSGYLRMGVRL